MANSGTANHIPYFKIARQELLKDTQRRLNNYEMHRKLLVKIEHKDDAVSCA